jgi:hypothetical protein
MGIVTEKPKTAGCQWSHKYISNSKDLLFICSMLVIPHKPDYTALIAFMHTEPLANIDTF